MLKKLIVARKGVDISPCPPLNTPLVGVHWISSLLSRTLNTWISKPRSFLLRMFVSVQNGHLSANVSDCRRNASVIATFPLRIIICLKNTCKQCHIQCIYRQIIRPTRCWCWRLRKHRVGVESKENNANNNLRIPMYMYVAYVRESRI